MASRFGPYTLIEKIGAGGMSAVYRAHDAKGRVVALSVLHRHLLANPVARRRFLLGPRSQPLHPNIVRVLDTGGEMPAAQSGELAAPGQSVPYFAMEYVEGQSLAQMMRDSAGRAGFLTPRDLYPILRDVAAALDAVHQRGIIHRDIKPGNILIRKGDGRVFLTDFGVAKSVLVESTTSLDSQPLGSPVYMSPEQADTGTNLTPACDVYALGVTAYEALCGRLPFEAENSLAVMNMHRTQKPPDLRDRNPSVPLSVAAVVMRALNKRPVDRYASAGEFAHAYLNAVMDSAARKAAPAAKVPARLIALVSVVTLIAIAGGVVSVALGPGAASPPGGPTVAPSPVTAATATASQPSPAVVVAGTPMVAGPAPAGSIAPAAPTPTLAPAISTEVPATVATPAGPRPASTLRLEAVGRAGYEAWGSPIAPGSCQTDDRRGRVQRFKTTVRLTNTSAAPIERYSAAFFDTGGARVTACVDGALPAIPPNDSRVVTYLAYVPARDSVARLTIAGEGLAPVSACYAGESPAACP